MPVTNLQDTILTQLQQERQAVTVIITNGFQLRGRITAFDQSVVVVEIRNEQQVIYKHAISIITPSQPVNLSNLEDHRCE